jgi:hypothetical protein
MMREETGSISDFDPEDVDVQAVDCFHHGGNLFSASFELSDPFDECSRSYLLEIERGASLRYSVRLQVEDAIRSHISFSPKHHLALELGGIIHELRPAGETRTELSEGVLTRLWGRTPDEVYAIGERGVSYVRENGLWRQMETVDGAVLNGIHGRSDGPVYCVGQNGIVLRREGLRWDRLDVGSDDSFNAVLVDASGNLLLGGESGIAYEIRNGERLELESEVVDYFDICEFKGQRYWSDRDYGISVQVGERIVPMLETEQGFTMHASDKFLVMAAWPEFFIFDGNIWTGFEMGYNGEIYLSEIDPSAYPKTDRD